MSLESEFQMTDEFVSGDFTARLDMSISQMLDVLKDHPAPDEVREQITNTMYERVIPALRDRVFEFASFYDDIVIVVDDLDKGWPPRQLETYDVRMIRHLIEILKRIQRDFNKKDIRVKYLLCLRSDVYDVLVGETADRGKDNLISVDWSDREQLVHIINERVLSSFDGVQGDEAWEAFNPIMEDGREAIEHLIDTSLFRPRFLIEVSERVLSAAVNRGHNFVDKSDVEHAMRQMSLYLVSDFANEMRTVAGTPEDIFYSFLGASDLLTHGEVINRISQKFSDMDHDFVVELLLWYGFLGVVGKGDVPIFIYDRAYDFKRLLAERPENFSECLYAVNRAFIAGLNDQ